MNSNQVWSNIFRLQLDRNWWLPSMIELFATNSLYHSKQWYKLRCFDWCRSAKPKQFHLDFESKFILVLPCKINIITWLHQYGLHFDKIIPNYNSRKKMGQNCWKICHIFHSHFTPKIKICRTMNNAWFECKNVELFNDVLFIVRHIFIFGVKCEWKMWQIFQQFWPIFFLEL